MTLSTMLQKWRIRFQTSSNADVTTQVEHLEIGFQLTKAPFALPSDLKKCDLPGSSLAVYRLLKPLEVGGNVMENVEYIILQHGALEGLPKDKLVFVHLFFPIEKEKFPVKGVFIGVVQPFEGEDSVS